MWMYYLALSLSASRIGVDRFNAEVAGYVVHCAQAVVGWTAGVQSGSVARVIKDG